MKRLFTLSLALLLLFGATLSLSACGSNEPVYAEIVVENYGTIVVKLDPTAAPKTVKNFVKLAKNGFYEDSTFHRIIEGFMIQGGKSAYGETAKSIKGEFASNGVDNPLKHERGVISMARANDMNSASSQFFIVHETSPHLDGDYAAFGHVVEGMDVVDEIATVPTNYYDTPLYTVRIKRVSILSDYEEQ